MKKNYIEPSVKVVTVELQGMIALSPGGGDQVDGGGLSGSDEGNGGDALAKDLEDILDWIE